MDEKLPEVKIAELYSRVNWEGVNSVDRLTTGMLQVLYANSVRDTQRAKNYSASRFATLFLVGIVMLLSRFFGATPRTTMMLVLLCIFFLYVLDLFAAVGFKTVESKNLSMLEEEVKRIERDHPASAENRVG